jgi:tetratricopeptide (TPR) repeat protein
VIRCFLAWLVRLVSRPWRLLAVLVLLGLTALGAAVGGVQLWAQYHYSAGERALERYRLAEAREHLRHCLAAWPSSGRAHLLAARAARRASDFEEAEEHLRAVQRLLPGSEEGNLELFLLRAQSGGMDSVADYLRSLVEADHPQSPQILEAMARGYMDAFRFGEADFMLELWLRRQPDSIPALLFRGWVKEQQHVLGLAADDYRRALEIDPENEEAHLRLAGALVGTNRAEEAVPHLEWFLRRHPDDPETLVQLALCWNNLGQTEQARQALDDVLARQPRSLAALVARGRLALQDGDPAAAEGWLRPAAALNPSDYQAAFLLCKCLQQQPGKEKEAAEAGTRLEQLEADLARIRDILTERMSRTPHDPALHSELGAILLRRGSTREGLRWLKSALREDPDWKPAHGALADYYERSGDARRAAQHRQRAGPAAPAGGAAAAPGS